MFFRKERPVKKPNTRLQQEASSLAEIRLINVLTERAFVEIVSAKGQELTFEYWDKEGTPEDRLVSLKQEGDTLTLSHTNKEAWTDYDEGARLCIGLPTEYAGSLTIESEKEDVQIDPRYRLDQLSIVTHLGDVYLPLGVSAEGVALQSGMGDLYLGEIRANRFSATTTSGDISLAEIAADTVALTTASGDSTVEKLQVGALTATAASGDIVLKNGTISALNAQTAAGDVKVEKLECGTYYVTSASGDVDVRIGGQGVLKSDVGDVNAQLLNITGNVTMSSACGDIIATAPEDEHTRLVLQSVMGSTKTDWSHSISKGKDLVAGNTEGARTITAHVVSGDAKVTLPN